MAGYRLRFVCFVLVFQTLVNGLVQYPDQDQLLGGSKCSTTDGRNGTCRMDCSEHRVVHDRRNICSFQRDSIVWCCPEFVVPVQSRLSSEYPVIEEVCFNRMIEAIDNSSTPTSTGLSGRPNEYSHMVVLGWISSSGSVEWKCGGSLINPSFVLTAARCLDFRRNPDVVRVGGVNLLNDTNNEFVVDYVVKRTFVNPGYRASEYYNNLALLKVEKKPDHNDRPTPRSACLYLDRDPSQTNVLTMGFGTDGLERTDTYTLLQLNLTLLENEACKDHYKPSRTLPHGIVGSIVCANNPGIKLDACEGDAGGSMVFFENDGMKTPYIFALVSFGTICLSGNPGAYTRIHPYLPWIERIIKSYA